MNQRIRFFDLLRILCFCFVLYYHMIVHIGTMGWVPMESLEPFFSSANAHIASLAVSIFFVISGAGLMNATRETLDLRTFYRKRFTRILIPFYIVYFVTFVFRFLRARGISGTFLHENIPAWRFIFTLIGMDEWVNMHGYDTFSLGVGEWFLGCLVVFYLLFPLIRYFMVKSKYLTFAIATAAYVLVVLYFPFTVAPHMSILVKAYDFIIGMFLVLIWRKDHNRMLFVTIPVLLIWIFWPKELSVNPTFGLTIFSTAFFLTFSRMEGILQKCPWKVVDHLCRYSYELFLVHHIIIYQCASMADPYIHSIKDIVLLSLAELVIIAVATVLLHKLVDFILKRKRARQKNSNERKRG